MSVKISELTEGTLEELKEAGYIPVAIKDEKTLKILLSKLLSNYQPVAMPMVTGNIRIEGNRYPRFTSLKVGETIAGYLVNSLPTDPTTGKSYVLCYKGGSDGFNWVNVEDIGGGSGDNNKVAVSDGQTAGFLADILKSATDYITLTKVGDQLRINFNGDLTSDPKLTTMSMNEINAVTNNYGSWWGNKPAWGDTNCGSICYQLRRLSDAQGVVNECRVFVSQPGAQSLFRVGIFDLDDNLLGATELVDVSGSEPGMVSAPMVEAFEGGLNIQRNTEYIIKVVALGVGFGGSEHSTTANWTFDFTCGYNLKTTQGGIVWPAKGTGGGITEDAVPFVTFGASED